MTVLLKSLMVAAVTAKTERQQHRQQQLLPLLRLPLLLFA
jgi:hypothetical protein